MSWYGAKNSSSNSTHFLEALSRLRFPMSANLFVSFCTKKSR